jgi:hypothetical protein
VAGIHRKEILRLVHPEETSALQAAAHLVIERRHEAGHEERRLHRIGSIRVSDEQVLGKEGQNTQEIGVEAGEVFRTTRDPLDVSMPIGHAKARKRYPSQSSESSMDLGSKKGLNELGFGSESRGFALSCAPVTEDAPECWCKFPCEILGRGRIDIPPPDCSDFLKTVVIVMPEAIDGGGNGSNSTFFPDAHNGWLWQW